MVLSPKAEMLLIEFRQNANPADLHPNDRERWRQFVIKAHNDGLAIAEEDVSDVLRQQWHSDVAVSLAADYCYSRELLTDYDAWLGR